MCSGTILERFEPTVRDTDVFTATIAKCGQTWLTSILDALRAGGDAHGADLVDRVPWLEIPWDPRDMTPYDVEDRLAYLASRPDPRVFKMHVVWDEIPRPPGCTAKILTITRDPRDVPWSMYKHLQALRMGPWAELDAPPPFEAFFERWFDNFFYERFVQSFWPHRDDPDVLWLRFEDMKQDPLGHGHRINAFLGWNRTEAEVAAAVERTGFRSLRALEDSGKHGVAKAFKQPFFREGAVGKNRQHLTPEMEGRIVDRIRATFDAECADFLLAQG